MAYDVRLVKIITGELIIGKFDKNTNILKDVAIMQTAPSKEGGMQLMMIPYGYPFEQNMEGEIAEKHFLYIYNRVPQELIDKYLETSSNITLKSDGFNPTPDSGSGLIL